MRTIQCLIIVIFLISLGSSELTAQPVRMVYNSGTEVVVDLYQVVDVVFTAKKKPAGSPFDVEFGASVADSKGISKRIPGFYNDRNEWVLRFSSNIQGTYSFHTFSTLPELSGLTGTMVVNTKSKPDKHGTVIVDPANPQHFSYEDGTSYFALAFELDWLFALDYHNKQGIPKTEKLIGEVANNGFNQVVMNVYAYDVGWPSEQNLSGNYEYRKPDFFPFLGTNEMPDYSALNPEYFKHLDRVIHLLDEKNMVAHLMIYVWNKKVNWPSMNSKADNLYFDYVIARYQAFPNIIWDVSKEALDYGRCDIPYLNERIARIRQNDYFNRLITVHDYEYCSREPDRVDFISVQNWRSELYTQMIDVRNRHNDQPVMNIEHGGYEKGPYLSFKGNYTNAETCLIRNYESVFAGVYSTYYWQNTSWNIVVYDPFDNPEINPKPKFVYYKHLAALFEKYNYNKLNAQKPKLTTNARKDPDNLSTGGFCLTNGSDLFLYFVPEELEYLQAVFNNPLKKKLKVTWFNIYSGEFSVEGKRDWYGWDQLVSPWPGTASIAIVELVDE